MLLEFEGKLKGDALNMPARIQQIARTRNNLCIRKFLPNRKR